MEVAKFSCMVVLAGQSRDTITAALYNRINHRLRIRGVVAIKWIKYTIEVYSNATNFHFQLEDKHTHHCHSQRFG